MGNYFFVIPGGFSCGRNNAGNFTCTCLNITAQIARAVPCALSGSLEACDNLIFTGMSAWPPYPSNGGLNSRVGYILYYIKNALKNAVYKTQLLQANVHAGCSESHRLKISMSHSKSTLQNGLQGVFMAQATPAWPHTALRLWGPFCSAEFGFGLCP